jgi:hypothetical protein
VTNVLDMQSGTNLEGLAGKDRLEPRGFSATSAQPKTLPELQLCTSLGLPGFARF